MKRREFSRSWPRFWQLSWCLLPQTQMDMCSLVSLSTSSTLFVQVENYPGVMNITGPALVAWMRRQAAHFGAVFEDDIVKSIDTSKRPFVLVTNNTQTVLETHTVIVATGAESNWLGIPGEYELRGGGVSACATCDGFLYSDKHVLVVGGGDTAMEDARTFSCR